MVTVTIEFRLEIIDLQCDENLKYKFHYHTLVDIRKLRVPWGKLPVLSHNARHYNPKKREMMAAKSTKIALQFLFMII